VIGILARKFDHPLDAPRALTDLSILTRFNFFMHTEEGRAYMDKLWKCTLEELDMPEVRLAMTALRQE
jgi:hypothetical protein